MDKQYPPKNYWRSQREWTNGFWTGAIFGAVVILVLQGIF